MTATVRSTALDTVLDYHRAWTDRAMTRVADDIVCRASGGDLTGKDAYREESVLVFDRLSFTPPNEQQPRWSS